MRTAGTPADRLVCDLTQRHRLHDPYPQTVTYRAAFRICPDDGPELSVGSAEIVVLPRWDQATFDALDDQSWDLAAFGQLLRRGYFEILTELRGEDPRDAAADRTSATSATPGVVLVDRVCVDECWRGRHFGLVGTGLALRALRRGAAFAVLYPMQPGLGADADRLASRRSLSRYWARIGFTHRYEEHLLLDLAGEDLHAGLDALARDCAGAEPFRTDAEAPDVLRLADGPAAQQDAPRTSALG